MCAYLKLALLPEFMVNGFIFQQHEWAQVTRKAHDPVAVTMHFWAPLARDVISSSLTARNGALPCVHKKSPETQPASSRELTIPSPQLSPSLSSSALLPGQHVNPKFLILVQVLELNVCSHWVKGKGINYLLFWLWCTGEFSGKLTAQQLWKENWIAMGHKCRNIWPCRAFQHMISASGLDCYYSIFLQ